MSYFSVETLKCTGCSVEYKLPLEQWNAYADGPVKMDAGRPDDSQVFYQLLERRAWCVECNCPVLVERVPTEQEFMNAIALKRNPKANLDDFNDDLLRLSVEDLGVLYERLSGRRSAGVCLQCGSRHWIGFEPTGRGELTPALLHDECNSPFKWSMWFGSAIRRGGTLKAKAFSFDGQLLAEWMI